MSAEPQVKEPQVKEPQVKEQQVKEPQAKKVLKIDLIGLINKLDDNQLYWLKEIEKWTGCKIQQSDGDEVNEISMEEFLKMPFLANGDYVSKPRLDMMKIVVKCDPTKDYEVSFDYRSQIRDYGFDLHWLNTEDYRDMPIKFVQFTENFGWGGIRNRLNGNLKLYNIWASAKTLLYCGEVPSDFKFKRVIGKPATNNVAEIDHMADEIIKQSTDISELVSGHPKYPIQIVLSRTIKKLMEERKKYTESMAKLAECLK
jgi:hypothetical protein